VHVIKQAQETKPKIPSYYFKLATLLVAH